MFPKEHKASSGSLTQRTTTHTKRLRGFGAEDGGVPWARRLLVSAQRHQFRVKLDYAQGQRQEVSGWALGVQQKKKKKSQWHGSWAREGTLRNFLPLLPEI